MTSTGINTVWRLAVAQSALAASPGLADAVGRLAERFPGAVYVLSANREGVAPANVNVVSTLDTAPGKVWFLIGGEKPEGRQDIIAVVSGTERREKDIVWLKEWGSIANLQTVDAAGGVARVLRSESPEAIRKGILDLHAPALRALREKGAAYVFGTHRLGVVVGEGLRGLGYRIAGFLDNNSKAWGSTVLDTAVDGINENSDRSLPIIIGTTRFPFTLGRQAKQAGFPHVLPYPILTLIDSKLFPPEIPYIGVFDDLPESRARYLTEYLNYSDDRSRQVLDRLLMYRTTFQSEYVQEIFDPEIDQYFDRDVMRLSSDEVFVDAGGFDGATTLEFIKRCGGSYRQIYYFEPDERLMRRSREEALAGREAVEYCAAGAFSFDGTASFCSTGTVNGSISSDAQGDIQINVRQIDSVAKVPPTFIKMDIEGAEYEALKGARHQIAAHAPKLAVAVYHQGPDIWRLPALIRDLYPHYRLYLRHYTEGGLETVLYAIDDKGHASA
jgi:FkbM family methyltransferase